MTENQTTQEIMKEIFADTEKRVKEREVLFESVNVETGAAGEPVVVRKLNKTSRGAPARLQRKIDVEVQPGLVVTLSQNAIDEAVRLTSDPLVEEHLQRVYDKKKKQFAEVKEDLEISKQVIQSMIDKANTPVNEQEKYVSYDAMPSPLQRVVKAYIDAEAANKELTEALQALKLAPPVVPAS